MPYQNKGIRTQERKEKLRSLSVVSLSACVYLYFSKGQPLRLDREGVREVLDQNLEQAAAATVAVFDTDNRGTVETLEVLAGLLMLCDGPVDRKLDALVGLFDLRGGGFLTALDVELLLSCAHTALQKLAPAVSLSLPLPASKGEKEERLASFLEASAIVPPRAAGVVPQFPHDLRTVVPNPDVCEDAETLMLMREEEEEREREAERKLTEDGKKKKKKEKEPKEKGNEKDEERKATKEKEGGKGKPTPDKKETSANDTGEAHQQARNPNSNPVEAPLDRASSFGHEGVEQRGQRAEMSGKAILSALQLGGFFVSSLDFLSPAVRVLDETEFDNEADSPPEEKGKGEDWTSGKSHRAEKLASSVLSTFSSAHLSAAEEIALNDVTKWFLTDLRARKAVVCIQQSCCLPESLFLLDSLEERLAVALSAIVPPLPSHVKPDTTGGVEGADEKSPEKSKDKGKGKEKDGKTKEKEKGKEKGGKGKDKKKEANDDVNKNGKDLNSHSAAESSTEVLYDVATLRDQAAIQKALWDSDDASWRILMDHLENVAVECAGGNVKAVDLRTFLRAVRSFGAFAEAVMGTPSEISARLSDLPLLCRLAIGSPSFSSPPAEQTNKETREEAGGKEKNHSALSLSLLEVISQENQEALMTFVKQLVLERRHDKITLEAWLPIGSRIQPNIP
uniref:EF-hand domain-containing protein n=1 Tax=Chromera velia CCMP2878 TaxID=1169474 RepID=A0A0G4H213_9ALVE|eukprot:Cvel_24379.t1-p1 / transcript=Cvel_24379.t1 / gene=Cvel_24379 / organism=Chromera_velia_CCMP2878 / gene_product=hypothetical protein / transcript_product=hypothetical protein / location=Cvel_scaffold2627:10038-21124(-) / protein_length=678 / sequence_SO=supercontig / SO=protein_coding / is_pseudo=false